MYKEFFAMQILNSSIIKNQKITLSGGSLGSWVDEERSKLRDIVWTAGHMIVDISNAYCGSSLKYNFYTAWTTYGWVLWNIMLNKLLFLSKSHEIRYGHKCDLTVYMESCQTFMFVILLTINLLVTNTTLYYFIFIYYIIKVISHFYNIMHINLFICNKEWYYLEKCWIYQTGLYTGI